MLPGILDRTLGRPVHRVEAVGGEVTSSDPVAEVERLEAEVKRLKEELLGASPLSATLPGGVRGHHGLGRAAFRRVTIAGLPRRDRKLGIEDSAAARYFVSHDASLLISTTTGLPGGNPKAVLTVSTQSVEIRASKTSASPSAHP